jgi:hypothetical protein
MSTAKTTMHPAAPYQRDRCLTPKPHIDAIQPQTAIGTILIGLTQAEEPCFRGIDGEP